jgi:hypothetical protein
VVRSTHAGPYDMQGSVVSTATIAPAFRLNNSLPPPDDEAAVAGSRAWHRARALAVSAVAPAPPPAPVAPVAVGTPLTMAVCAAATNERQQFEKIGAGAGFALKLKQHPTLCTCFYRPLIGFPVTEIDLSHKV